MSQPFVHFHSKILLTKQKKPTIGVNRCKTVPQSYLGTSSNYKSRELTKYGPSNVSMSLTQKLHVFLTRYPFNLLKRLSAMVFLAARPPRRPNKGPARFARTGEENEEPFQQVKDHCKRLLVRDADLTFLLCAYRNMECHCKQALQNLRCSRRGMYSNVTVFIQLTLKAEG